MNLHNHYILFRIGSAIPGLPPRLLFARCQNDLMHTFAHFLTRAGYPLGMPKKIVTPGRVLHDFGLSKPDAAAVADVRRSIPFD